MHRDVKPENILFVDSGKFKYSGRVKLIDFGTSIRFTPGEYQSDIYGSPSYLAPEVLNREYTEKCDLWSLGVILYTLIHNHLPYDGFDDKELITRIKTASLGFKEALDKNKSIEVIDLMKRMLFKDFKSRSSAKEVKYHKWIRVQGRDPNLNYKIRHALKCLRSFESKGNLQMAALRYVS